MKTTITLTTIFLLISFISVAQTAKWFVTIGSGYTVGGPSNSLKNKMYKAGWDDRENGIVSFFDYYVDYPTKTRYLPLMLSAGKKLIGVELFAQTTLAPPAKMDDFTKSNSTDKVAVNMTNLTLGLALAVRRK